MRKNKGHVSHQTSPLKMAETGRFRRSMSRVSNSTRNYGVENVQVCNLVYDSRSHLASPSGRRELSIMTHLATSSPPPAGSASSRSGQPGGQHVTNVS